MVSFFKKNGHLQPHSKKNIDKTECYLWLTFSIQNSWKTMYVFDHITVIYFLYTSAYIVFDTCDTSQTGWDGDNNLTGKVVKSSKSTCSPVHISQVVLVVHSSSRAKVERGPTLYETHDV